MNFRLIRQLARKILLEERPKISLGPWSEEDSGFCRYNAKINEYAADSPENLAEVLIFCVASQLVDWPNIYTRFPFLINWIYAHDGMYPKDVKMIGDKMEGGFPVEFSPIALGEKAKSINALWKNRDNVFSILSPFIRKYKNMKEGEAKEQAAFELYLKILDIRHLKLAKAGFAVQLLIGRYGCIDSINTKLLKVPMPTTLVTTDKEGKPSFRDYTKKYVDDSAFGVSAEGSKERLARLYADYLLEIGNLAKDNESKVLWDKWCDIVAAKINFAGKEFDVTDPQGIYKDATVKSDYAVNIKPTTPPASYQYGPGKKEIEGPEVSRQHAGLYRGLRDITENNMNNKLKSIILEQLLEMLNEKTFAGKKELDNDGDGVPKWADKDDTNPKIGSKSSKKKELDEISSMSAGSVEGYAAPLDEEDDTIVEYLTEEEAKKKQPRLGKVTRNPAGSNKKFHVYVKCNGRVKKISFGDPGLSIKRDSPERRKNFRARHKCDKPEGKNRCTARYWSCYQWRAGKKVEGE